MKIVLNIILLPIYLLWVFITSVVILAPVMTYNEFSDIKHYFRWDMISKIKYEIGSAKWMK